MRDFEAPRMRYLWKVRAHQLRGIQHAWFSLDAAMSLCRRKSQTPEWIIAPTGLNEKKRCQHCLAAIERIEREKREAIEREYL